MRIALHPGSRLLGRLPRPTPFGGLELVLLGLLAIQAARLFWTLSSPVVPVGEWGGAGAPAAADADADALGSFDPFFRSGEGGEAVAATLDIKLFGVREDRATGRGSAIIALADGPQLSFVVGDEIAPGVTLAEVGFDSVTISGGDRREQIFLDPSLPARPIAEAAATAPAASAAAPDPQIRFQPRVSGGRVEGLAVGPGSDGGYALRAAGLEPGDVIVSINGRRVTSVDQAQTIARQARGEVSVIVNRGGRAVPLQMSLDL